MQPTREDRSLGELFSELTREVTTLIRQEMTLAKTEMSGKARSVGKDLGFVAAGGLVAYAGFLVLLAFLVLLLGTVLPLWASALIVGAVVTIIGAFMVKHYLSAFSDINPTPTETVQTLKEDQRWLKEQV